MEFRSRNSEESLKARDKRPQTTSRIWMWAMIMMPMTIPMVALTRSSVVPLAIIAGAALSSAALWIFGGSSARLDKSEREILEQSEAESARLRGKVEDLEERLFALETIGRYEQARRDHAEESRFGSPHQASHQAPARDPLLPERASNPSAARSRPSRITEG